MRIFGQCYNNYPTMADATIHNQPMGMQHGVASDLEVIASHCS